MKDRASIARVLRHTVQTILCVVVVACDTDGSTNSSGAGTAVVKMIDREWRLSGMCESANGQLTFTAPGDPMLTIGFNTVGEAAVVGNFNLPGEGFGVIIGHPDAPTPSVTGSDGNYSISGMFLVIDYVNHVSGEIELACNQ